MLNFRSAYHYFLGQFKCPTRLSTELEIYFPVENQVVLRLGPEKIDPRSFNFPLNTTDRQEIRWYLETYAFQYTADVDDKAAQRIVNKLPQWGEILFQAVFDDLNAQRLFKSFQDDDTGSKLFTISTNRFDILSLPWELLRVPKGSYLFLENPPISIRRGLPRKKWKRVVQRKRHQENSKLRLLFIVSRPTDVPFMEFRADTVAVLDILDKVAANRVEVEFLRPATLHNLTARLRDKHQPTIDIIHFDGHGVFNKKESMGYLLFTKPNSWTIHRVSAQKLGLILGTANIPLVILSACQSAMIGDSEEPMGTVAVQLTHAGVPSVIAMTHSVHVNTSSALFSAFYHSLMQGKDVGEALNHARRALYQHPDRIEHQRGQERVTLKLSDWFLPVLYQTGPDIPVLQNSEAETKFFDKTRLPCNLPQLQEAGFFGRTRELWLIEHAFFVLGKRSLTISGFGGQGKTYLAIEAGQWLSRTGMFQSVCFVDYTAFQGVDVVNLAVSTLATVLDKNLVDAAAASQALGEISTLLIFDNVDAIPPESLTELLEVAKQWAEMGDSRILLTTRKPNFNHADYAAKKHQYLLLDGLAKEEALAYFQSLLKLPPAPQVGLPKREELLRLFKKVHFHPLSIRLLASLLKMMTPDKLGERLEVSLEEMSLNPVLASLNLSLERWLEKLDEGTRRWLLKLGVFQGGAFEKDLLQITEFSQEQWYKLRHVLETSGLIQSEYLSDIRVPYLKFHPILASALWARLGDEEQVQLLARHRQCYYQLSKYLYVEDNQNPYETRAIAQRELPNLLSAVYGALEADEEWTVEFVNNIDLFLNIFELKRDRAALSQQVEHLGGKVGSRTWFLVLSNKGERLFSEARYQVAAQVFSEVLTGLTEQTSYEYCTTLNWLGRCFAAQGQAAQAAEYYQKGLAVAEKLETSEQSKRQIGVLQGDLADVLREMGNYQEAKNAYESALRIDKELGQLRHVAVNKGQLGTLALSQGNLAEAEKCYREALATFRQLNEPETEAIALHQLGVVYQKAKQWEAAEKAYRESARLKESQGNLVSAAATWNNLALIKEADGKFEEAEIWYRKALEIGKEVGDEVGVFKRLYNLAKLLKNQPNHLKEAKQLAEEALAVSKTLDPAVAEIWETYELLAQIAKAQNNTTKATEYHHRSQKTRTAFASMQ